MGRTCGFADLLMALLERVKVKRIKLIEFAVVCPWLRHHEASVKRNVDGARAPGLLDLAKDVVHAGALTRPAGARPFKIGNGEGHSIGHCCSPEGP